jgi:hypothetical protein
MTSSHEQGDYAMVLYKRKSLVLIKPETGYGTDPTPNGANAMRVTDLTVKPAEGDKLERNLITPDLSTQPFAIANPRQSVSFSFELCGAGSAGSVPECGPVLRAAGFSQAITAGIDVRYQLVSENMESAAIYVNVDGELFVFLGCRGDVSLDFTGGKYPTGQFSGMALFAAPVTAVAATPVYKTQLPLVVNKANTQFSFGGYAAVLHQLSAKMGWKTAYLDLPNLSPVVDLTGRQCSGKLVMDAVKQETRDFWAAWRTSTAQELSLEHGVEAGSIIKLAAPAVQAETIDLGDKDGRLTFDQPIRYTRSAGDDELTLTFK